MTMSPKLLLPAILGAFVVFVAFVFWYKSQSMQQEVAGLPPGHPSTIAAPSGDDSGMSDAPSKDNVNHNFLAEENRLQMAVEESPNDTVSIVKLARFYHDAHSLEKAIPMYERYLKLRPENTQAWADLADCQVNLQDMDAARATMEAALEHFPDNPTMLYNLGAIHANAGRFPLAIQYWKQVSTMDADESVKNMAIAGLEKLQ